MRNFLRRSVGASVWVAAVLLIAVPGTARAQASARLLLSSGSAVPGNPGFLFGPFSDLAMNTHRQIVFLSTIQSPRNQRNVIVRSSGISFSVAVFQGLVSPIQGMLFDSFSAPSLNASGDIAFTAKLVGLDAGTPPMSGVFRLSGESVHLVTAAGQSVAGEAAALQQFSAPVIGSSGAVLFAGRASGIAAASGLFLWTPQGISRVDFPPGFMLSPGELLVPIFQSQDESVWAGSNTPPGGALDQFFRAVADKSFQQLTPPPDTSATVTVLGPAPAEKPAHLLLVVLDGEKAETAALEGDPAQPVLGKASSGPALDLPLAGIEGQAPGTVSGSVIFAATPLAHPDDLGLYCFCNGQAVQETSPQDLLILGPAPQTVQSMAGDGQHTIGLIAHAASAPGSNAIYAVSLP